MRRLRPWVLVLAFSTALGSLSSVRAEGFAEADVRAVFLLNFAIFVDWPASAFESSSAPYRYCVLGSQVLRTSLASALLDEHVGERPLQLVSAHDPPAWRRCHVLYLDGSVPQRERVLSAVRDTPVLTVGDSEAFARDGGMIGLVRRGGRLKAVINRDAALREGISISSKLLRLATLVSGGGN